MKTSNFNYRLPSELIAQKPRSPRDSSRLMILNVENKTIKHDRFFNLPNYLQKGDLLVFNNSKVIKARLFGSKNIEIFLLNPQTAPTSGVKKNIWQVLAKPGKKLKQNAKIYFSKNFFCEPLGRRDERTFLVKFNLTGKKFRQAIEKFGHIPVPPYIKKEPKKFKQYQTVYAKRSGSVAAPTAGLHFTKRLFKKLKQKGVQIEYATLHIGLGTFAPVKVKDITKHIMHPEFAILNKTTAERLNRAKKRGRRIIAVGTTTCRILESAITVSATTKKAKCISRFRGYYNYTDIFIHPPYRFKAIDGLITNFHLPKSTLLMLVSAFASSQKKRSVGLRKSAKYANSTLSGENFILNSYEEAIKKKYRFYSFGDAMFIY